MIFTWLSPAQQDYHYTKIKRYGLKDVSSVLRKAEISHALEGCCWHYVTAAKMMQSNKFSRQLACTQSEAELGEFGE